MTTTTYRPTCECGYLGNHTDDEDRAAYLSQKHQERAHGHYEGAMLNRYEDGEFAGW